MDTIPSKKHTHYSEIDRCYAQDRTDVYSTLGCSAGFLQFSHFITRKQIHYMTESLIVPVKSMYRLPLWRAGLGFSVARRFCVLIGTNRSRDPCPTLFWSRPNITSCFVTWSDAINWCIIACNQHVSIRFAWRNRIYTYVVTTDHIVTTRLHCTSHPCCSSLCPILCDSTAEKWMCEIGYRLDKVILNQILNLICNSGVLLPHIYWQICVLNVWTFALTNLFLLPCVIQVNHCLSLRTREGRQLFCCRISQVTTWPILEATELLLVTLRWTFAACLCALETKQLLATCRKVHEHCAFRRTAVSIVEDVETLIWEVERRPPTY
jgi:hypothetical protein